MEFTKLTEGVVRRTISNCGAQVNTLGSPSGRAADGGG